MKDDAAVTNESSMTPSPAATNSASPVEKDDFLPRATIPGHSCVPQSCCCTRNKRPVVSFFCVVSHPFTPTDQILVPVQTLNQARSFQKQVDPKVWTTAFQSFGWIVGVARHGTYSVCDIRPWHDNQPRQPSHGLPFTPYTARFVFLRRPEVCSGRSGERARPFNVKTSRKCLHERFLTDSQLTILNALSSRTFR